jgi:hypothetical protein
MHLSNHYQREGCSYKLPNCDPGGEPVARKWAPWRSIFRSSLRRSRSSSANEFVGTDVSENIVSLPYSRSARNSRLTGVSASPTNASRVPSSLENHTRYTHSPSTSTVVRSPSGTGGDQFIPSQSSLVTFRQLVHCGGEILRMSETYVNGSSAGDVAGLALSTETERPKLNTWAVSSGPTIHCDRSSLHPTSSPIVGRNWWCCD